MPLKGAKHNDFFGDIPEPNEHGDLWLPPGAQEQLTCGRPVWLEDAQRWMRCDWTFIHRPTPFARGLAARALARHHKEEHTLYPRGEEATQMAIALRSPRKMAIPKR